MKVYNLCCAQEHHFEGWFSSEEDFSAQASQQLIACPVCAEHRIRKLPSAPRLNLSSASASPDERTRAAMQAHWLSMMRHIVANTEDVGENFVEEARRIHYKERPARGIRGVASLEEQEALAEEGIEVVQIPLPEVLKQPLQ